MTNKFVSKIEHAWIFMLGMAIFISKPLIYLSILLLLVLTLVRAATDANYRRELSESKLFWASTGVFVLGLFYTLIGSGHAQDVGWMASKTMLLPMVVPLLLAFDHTTNRTAAIAGVVLGFWIAFVLTVNMHNWVWSGDRYEGATWLIDTWGVICAMLILLITPLLFVMTKNWVFRLVLLTTLMGGMLMLVTTGARGPWLGVVAGVFVYLAIKQRRALIVVAGLCLACIFVASSLWPQQMEAFKHRAQSISNTDSDTSITLRLAMWETGHALISKQLISGDKGFWFGYLKKGRGNLPNDFYYNEFIHKAKVKPGLLKEHGWKLTDFHNSYLESVFRNGIFWTVASLFILIWVSIGPLQQGQGWSRTLIAVPLLIGFLVIGMSYTLLPHFAFLFLIFFITLGRRFE